MKKRLAPMALMIAMGLMCFGVANAQQITGDDLTLDGAGSSPAIKFNQSDGDAVLPNTYATGAGFYFQETNSFPFYMFETAPSASLYLRSGSVDVGTLLKANASLEVTGTADISGNLTVDGKPTFNAPANFNDSASFNDTALFSNGATINGNFVTLAGADIRGNFDASGDNFPTFSTASGYPGLTLANSATNANARFTPIGDGFHFSFRDTAGATAFPIYAWDSPMTEQLVVRGDQSVEPGIGIGTFYPEAELHIYADGSPHETAEFIVENNVDTVAIREMFQLINNGGVRFAMENTDQGTRWDFTNNTIGDFLINLAGTGGPEMGLTTGGRFFTGPAGFKAFDARPNGNVWIAGTYNQTSDRTKKENFEDVDPDEVLEKLSKVPVTKWNYKNDEDSVVHMGPMAQDFHAAFELGESDRVIALADMFGVSVTAIQALHDQSKEKDLEIEELKKQLAKQADQIAAQVDHVKQLEAMQTRLERLESAVHSQ